MLHSHDIFYKLQLLQSLETKKMTISFNFTVCVFVTFFKDHISVHQEKEKILRILSKKNFNDIQVRGKSTSIEPHLRLLYSRVQAKYFTYRRFQPWVSHK